MIVLQSITGIFTSNIPKTIVMKKLHLILSVLILAATTFTACKKEPGESPSKTGMVYIMDNAVNGNHVIAFKRSMNGTLKPAGEFATKGNGTGSGLGSQGSVVLHGQYLFVCNAGSNDITVFRVMEEGLQWVHKISSNGITPVSLTVYNNLLYVLNTGKVSNISGYRISNSGHLAMLAGSDRPLSDPMAGGAQVEFNNSGSQLVVTEKATNRISTYAVFSNGLPGTGAIYPSAGKTPFGFEFTKNGILVVSEAAGGEPAQSTLSSYTLNSNGSIHLITGPVATHQTAACWVAVTDNGKYAYTTNTQSASISGFSISNSGALMLLDANGVTGVTGMGPNDLALSMDSEYLYTLNVGEHSISCFKVNNNGGLTSLGEVSGIPQGSVGMAAK